MNPDEFASFIGQWTEDPEVTERAREIATDPEAFLNTPHLPEDAGEYAEGLTDILRHIPPGWGRWISCGKGWYPLLVETNRRLAALDPDYEVHQVKEKYGGLRFYHQFVTKGADQEAGSKIEAETERRSYTICELCGAPGFARDDHGWIRTLCDEHGGGQPGWDKDSQASDH